jgi:5-methylcytosine-specific restriction endonuclease McrA
VNKLGTRRWHQLREQVISEQENQCAWPGCAAQIDEIHHIVAITEPGGERLKFERHNVIGLCRGHHVKAHCEQPTARGPRRRRRQLPAGPPLD